MNNRLFDVVLFDLGNTLIYFDCDDESVFARMDAAMVDSLQASGLKLDHGSFLKQYRERLDMYEAERDSEFIEHSTTFIIRSLLTEAGLAQPDQSLIKTAMKARYAVSQAYWKLEEDTCPVLEVLRAQGYRLGIVSNAGDDDDVQTLIDNARMRAYFDVIATSAAQGIRKPNPRIFLDVLARLGVEPKRAAMVGDSLGADILGAQNVGLLAIWITRRADRAANRDHLDTIRPDEAIAALSELPALLHRLSKNNNRNPGNGSS
jgi:HAD superfamily hydrolase (TIGR01662 family)